MSKKMSKYLSFCNTRKNNKTKKSKKIVFSSHFECFGRMFLLAILVSLIVGYVFLANFGTTKGFEIADLGSKIKVLEDNNKSLTNQVSEMKSLSQAEERAQAMYLVAVDKVEYLRTPGSMAFNK